jgi:pheromone shutdown protein TraB
MAAKLRAAGDMVPKPRELLAVVGAGHLKGLRAALEAGSGSPSDVIATLDTVKAPSRIPWFTIVFASTLFGVIGWGFWQGGADLGSKLLLDWVLITALGGAIGAAAAGAHPLSILAGAVTSPVTPLLPQLASGMFSALVEAWVRKPTYQDMLNLRQDTSTIKGWWRNRFARVFVNFNLTCAGTAIGAWIAGLKLIHGLG